MTFRGLLLSALLCGVAIPAHAFLDGTTHGVIAPTFNSASGASSFIRLFSGAGNLGATSTFTVTIQGATTGNIYGTPFTIDVPYGASAQYSLSQFLSYAGVTALLGSDTSYAVYLRNIDPEAGYQHVTYSQTSGLFENLSNCVSTINERMVTLHNQVVLTNVHTAKVGGGNAGASGPTVAANSGKYTCQYPGNTFVPGNSTLAIPEATIAAASGCTIDSDQFYDTFLIENANGPTTVSASHLVTAAAYGGQSNLTTVCAVNRAPLTTSVIPLVFLAPTGTTFSLTAPQGIQAFDISGLALGPAGTPVVSGTFQESPTGSLVTTATGFTFTLPDGKTANFLTTPGSNGFDGLNNYDVLTTDGSRHVEIHLTNEKNMALGSSTYGYWVEGDASGDTPLVVGTIATGIATAAVPTTGSATYTGNITGVVATAANTGVITGGKVSITVNYAAKTFTGNITAMTAIGVEQTTVLSVNNLSLSGTFTGGALSGGVAAGAGGSTAFDISGTTGTFTATFNGTNAAEMSGNIPITVAGKQVLAAFGARK